MAYNKRNWKARQGTGLNKFSINGATPVTVVNQPDSLTEQGDALSAGNLNDWEQRIADGFASASGELADAVEELESEDTALRSAINANSNRIANLEQKAGDYSIVQYRGTNAVPTGKAKYGLVKSIVGKTRAWNQLVVSPHLQGSFSTGEHHVNGIKWENGRKYLMIVYGLPANCFVQTDGQYPMKKMTSDGATIFTAPASFTDSPYFYNNSGASVTVDCYVIIRDVSLILSDWADADITTANIPLMVQQIPDLLKWDAYDAESLVDTEVSGVESRDSSDNVLDTLSLSEPVTLRSAGSVAEVLTLETGKKTRPIGSVDLGTLNWIKYTYNGVDYYSAPLSNSKPSTINVVANCLSSKFICIADTGAVSLVEENPSGSFWISFVDGSIYVIMSGYSTASEFASSVSGQYLYYELATPDTDEQVCDPIIDNFIEVEGGGTIDTIQTQSPVIDNCLDVGYLTL